jgi:hypothetical protein
MQLVKIIRVLSQVNREIWVKYICGAYVSIITKNYYRLEFKSTGRKNIKGVWSTVQVVPHQDSKPTTRPVISVLIISCIIYE